MSASSRSVILAGAAAIILAGAALVFFEWGEKARFDVAAGEGQDPNLPVPKRTLVPTLNLAKAIGWPAGAKPAPANGLAVAAFAEGLVHPRWMTVLPNGDVLVAETNAPTHPKVDHGFIGNILNFSPHDWVKSWSMKRAGAFVPSPERITLLRDTKGTGVADMRSVFINKGLHTPFGMVLSGGYLYVADTDALLRFPYKDGDTAITEPGVKIVDLPAGDNNHHCFKNVSVSPDGTKLYVTVGSNSNVGENGIAAEEGRAAIWEVDVATGEHRIFASGLRNPNGLAWEPTTNELWTTVNERDELGSDLVPDYMTRVKFGQFYGWPWNYYGDNIDTRVKEPKPAALSVVTKPDYALGSHTASLGIAFAAGANLGRNFADGAFVAQHGSWNRNPRSGYKVVFVPFTNGMPAADVKPADVLTGFLDADGEAQGRPVDVVLDKTGSLLVTDDVGNKIWRVTAAAASAQSGM